MKRHSSSPTCESGRLCAYVVGHTLIVSLLAYYAMRTPVPVPQCPAATCPDVPPVAMSIVPRMCASTASDADSAESRTAAAYASASRTGPPALDPSVFHAPHACVVAHTTGRSLLRTLAQRPPTREGGVVDLTRALLDVDGLCLPVHHCEARGRIGCQRVTVRSMGLRLVDMDALGVAWSEPGSECDGDNGDAAPAMQFPAPLRLHCIDTGGADPAYACSGVDTDGTAWHVTVHRGPLRTLVALVG